MSVSDQGRDRDSTIPEEGYQLPTVAVVIPCCNHGKFIRDAVLSAVQQDYPFKCIIVLDDGSKDESFKIIEDILTHQQPTTSEVDQEFTTKMGLINGVPTVLMRTEKPSGGPSQARNLIIKHAWQVAHFFAILDADDQYLPGKISKSVAVMLEDPARIGLVYSDVLIHNIERNTYTYEAREPYDRFQLEHENTISNGPLINRLALDQVGLYDEELRTCEDWDLWLRITERFIAIHIPEPLQVYTVTGINATFTIDKRTWQYNWTKVQQKLKQRNAIKQ